MGKAPDSSVQMQLCDFPQPWFTARGAPLENKKHTYCDTLQSHQPKIKGMTITLQVDDASPGAPESARAGDPDSGATDLPTRPPARPLRRRYGRERCLPMPAPAASTWRGACDGGHPRVGGEHAMNTPPCLVCHGSSPRGRGTLQLQAIDMQRVYSL